MPWRLVVLVVACGSAAEVPATPSNHAAALPAAPDLAVLRALLAPHDREPFTAESVADRGCSVTPTFGEYVALLVKNGAPSTDRDTHTLVGGCGPFPTELRGVDPPVSPDY